MGEAKVGEEFIKHELDEAIAVQRTIVEAETRLASVHPEADAKRALQQGAKEDQKFLTELERLGREHGASGEVEEVAGGLQQLMQTTLQTAEQAESEAYEAHAVLLNLKRKQQDSAGAMLKIARQIKDTKMRDAAMAFEKGTKASANELSSQLAALAVRIATQGQNGRSRSAASARR